MSINTNVLNFYIEHNLINAVSAVLKDSSIEESDYTNIVNGIYSHYNSISSESLKNSLLQMYVKHEFYSVVLKILEQDGTTYSNIDSICTAINQYGNEDFKNRVKEDFLDYSNLSNIDFISSNLERAAYIYLNSDLEDVGNLEIDNQPFINKVISCYKYSKHHEWLNYIISHNNEMAYKLWINGISFDDDQLKSINLLASTEDSDNPFYYGNFIRDLRINPIDQYVKCSCSAIIKPFIESNVQINSTSYSVIDSSCNDTLFDLLFGDTAQFTIQNYSSSLLRKVNDFGLTHIFSYLKSNDKISNDVLEYLLNRSDCNANIKTLALCSFTAADLTTGLKSSNYSLYLEIFRAVLYSDFLYGALNGSLDPSQLSNFDTNYCNEIAKCTSESNLFEIFDYVYSRECYNILACLVYEKDLTSNDYVTIRSLASNNNFKPALTNNIGDSNTIARRSYKLLEHDCLDLFNYVVINRLSDSDCEAFCFSDSHYMYSKYRDYLVSYISGQDKYAEYTRSNPEDSLYNILALRLLLRCSNSDFKLLRFLDINFTSAIYALDSAANYVSNINTSLTSIIDLHKSDKVIYDKVTYDGSDFTQDEKTNAGDILQWAYNEYNSPALLDSFIHICDYCYGGLVQNIDGTFCIEYNSSFIHDIYENIGSIRVSDIPFDVRSYCCKNFAEYLCGEASITDDALVNANSLCLIALRILNGNYSSLLSNSVREYIVNNWKLLIPYITECYTHGCAPTSSVTYDYTLQSLSSGTISASLQLGNEANNQQITHQSSGVQWHPISTCYKQYTRHIIAEQCAGITESNLS